LIAIHPERKGAEGRTLSTLEECEEFIKQHNETEGIYYSINPTKEPIDKKPSKREMGGVEYLHSDVDPGEDETPHECWARVQPQIAAYDKKPTFIIRSGNGVHLLWRVDVDESDGARTIADIEARNYGLALAFGADASTRNIDRIFRLPGTINWPNEKKRKAGRVPALCELIEHNDFSYDLAQFAPAEVPAKKTRAKKSAPADKTSADKPNKKRRERAADVDRLEDVIRNGCYDEFETRSHAVWYVINEMLRRGYRKDAIVDVLVDRANKISEHIHEQSEGPYDYADRQVEQAIRNIDFARDGEGHVYATQDNIRVALLKLKVTVRYDQFADRILLEGLLGFGPTLEDAAVNRLWLLYDKRFDLRPTKGMLRTVLGDTAQLNGFHPVRDYLDSLQWDGVPRLDKWLTTYGGVKSTEYVDAVGALMLTAAVRRVRSPGCKFDEMVVFEGAEQGIGMKSTLLRALAVKDEWFTDALPLNAGGKEVIEALRGKWIVEVAELSGMRRADVEHVKAQLSRQVDRARMAYGRLVTEAPRQCIFIGTTNSQEYLKDTTGNRRFWPVTIVRFDIPALTADRDQLWAEAAMREAAGASIRLQEELYPDAARAQERRTTADPYVGALQEHLGHVENAKISSESVWVILDVKAGQRTQDQNARVGAALRAIGWRRLNSAGTVRINGKNVMGYVKGEARDAPWTVVTVDRSRENGRDELFVFVRAELPANNNAQRSSGQVIRLKKKDHPPERRGKRGR
jgi:predicted P-loop ATPase